MIDMERDDSKPATAKEAPWRAPISLEEPLFCVWIHGHNISSAFAKAIIAWLPLLCKRVFLVCLVEFWYNGGAVPTYTGSREGV